MTFSVALAHADTSVYSLFDFITPQPISQPRIPLAQPLIFGSISQEFTVIQPLPIDIEQDEDGTYVVGDNIFLVYGVGKDQERAIRDYVVSLLELYRILETGAQSNPFDHEQFIRLKSYVQPKSQRDYDVIQAKRD